MNKNELKEVIESLLYQFAYYSKSCGGSLTTGGLSALEEGFEALDWDDPHLCQNRTCQIKDCVDEAKGGVNLKSGKYALVCHTHRSLAEYDNLELKEEIKNKK